MPNPRNTAHQIRAGTFNSSGMGSTYQITNFTVQSDQIVDNAPLVAWQAPLQIVVPEYADVPQYADGSRRPRGYLKWTWSFSYWTFGMLGYWLTTFWPAGVYSAPVTVLVYDATDSAIYVNAMVYRPVIGKALEWSVGGYANVKVDFDFGKLTS